MFTSTIFIRQKVSGTDDSPQNPAEEGSFAPKQGKLKHCGIAIHLACQRGSMKFCLACRSSL
jgi:hypothetical protein